MSGIVYNAQLRGAVSRGVKACTIDGSGHLIFTMTDNSVLDLGKVEGTSVESYALVSGTHAPGSYDTYRMTLSDGSSVDCRVWNGADGTGAGDMVAAIYDPDEAVVSEGGIAGYVENVGVKIGTIKVNGEAQTITDKAVDLAVPTELADLASDSTHRTVTDVEKAAWDGKYSKDETLTAATAALYGFGSDAVPDDVFAFLGQFNKYTWRRRTRVLEYIESRSNITENVTQSGTSGTVYISSSISVDPDTGDIALDDAETYVYESVSFGAQHIVGSAPCYIRFASSDSVLYIPSGATTGMSITSCTVYCTPAGSGAAIIVSSDGSPRAQLVSAVMGEVIGEWEMLTSIYRTAYPDGGIVGGYEYEYLFRPFEHLTEIHTKLNGGTYIGTGTNGSGNKNSLPITARTRAVFIAGSGSSGIILRSLNGSGFACDTNGYIGALTVSWGDNTVEWYSAANATYQMNVNNITYTYTILEG